MRRQLSDEQKLRNKERNKRYYESNKVKILAKHKEYLAKNPDIRKAIDKRYAEKHPEKLRAKRTAYLKKTQDRRKVWGLAHRLRAIKRSNGIPPKLGFCFACLVPEAFGSHMRGDKEIKKSNLSVDHCHDEGFNRGWLCMSCNTEEGKHRRGLYGPKVVMGAHLVEYLERFSKGWDQGDGLAALRLELGL